jgi:hypothetical protein
MVMVEMLHFKYCEKLNGTTSYTLNGKGVESSRQNGIKCHTKYTLIRNNQML